MKIITSFCSQTLFLMYLLLFAKKILLYVDEYFEIIFSLVLILACNCKRVERGLKGAEKFNSCTGFQILAI